MVADATTTAAMLGSFSWIDFLLQVIFPTVGVFTGTFMNFAPYRAVLKASRDGNLGDLNPTPWIFMLGNCVGWLAYSYLLENMYVFLPNASGFILSIWLNVQAIKIQYENHRSYEMQTALIDALEKLHRSKDQKFNKDAVEEIVEQVIIEDPPPMDMIDPATTAPVIDEHHPYSHRSPNNENSNDDTEQQMTSTSTYDSINKKNDGKEEQNDEENIHDTKEDHDEANVDGGFKMLQSLQDDGGFSFFGNNTVHETVHEAAEAAIDYASFVWEIAAQRSAAPGSHEIMVIVMSTFWLSLITLVVFTQHVLTESTRILIIGLTCNLNLIFFYGAPLSKIATVLESRSSKLIHVPTMICSLMNGTLWFVYGVAVSDYFIAVPNGLGAALGVVQFILCMIFPRHRHPKEYYAAISDGESDTLTRASSTNTLLLPEEPAPLI